VSIPQELITATKEKLPMVSSELLQEAGTQANVESSKRCLLPQKA
jgi:hypothetical protein